MDRTGAGIGECVGERKGLKQGVSGKVESGLYDETLLSLCRTDGSVLGRISDKRGRTNVREGGSRHRVLSMKLGVDSRVRPAGRLWGARRLWEPGSGRTSESSLVAPRCQGRRRSRDPARTDSTNSRSSSGCLGDQGVAVRNRPNCDRRSSDPDSARRPRGGGRRIVGCLEAAVNSPRATRPLFPARLPVEPSCASRHSRPRSSLAGRG